MLHEQGERGIGCKRYQALSEQLITEILLERREVEFSSLALEIMERFPMRETHVKNLCKDMKARGLLDYALKPNAKKPSNGTFIMRKT